MFWKALLLWLVLVMSALSGRQLVLYQQRKVALSIFQQQYPHLNTQNLKIVSLNSLRGDMKIEYPKIPFEPLAWTVNIHTQQVIPWQSKKKESSY